LEFPLVFLVGMEENIFPSLRENDINYDEELEEERRLCYVGITRAKEQIILTAAVARRLYGQKMFNAPSQFIGEISPVWAKSGIINNTSYKESIISRRNTQHGRTY
jgi:DNA helicase II / ATP-dependent DNA helicase PcrA